MANNSDKSEQELGLINSLKHHGENQRSALYEKLATEQQERIQEENLDTTLDKGISFTSQSNDDGFDDTNVENTPGAILKHARLKLGLSIHDVALQLRLRINTIADIENERLNQPTSVTFARGNITRYARLVRVPEEVVQKLYDENIERIKAKAANSPRYTPRRRSKSHSKYLALLALLIVLIGVVLYINDTSVPDNYAQGEQESGSLNIANSETNVTINNTSTELTESASLEGTNEVAVATTVNTNTAKANNVDRNTQLAREQAQALGTNEIQTLTNLGKGNQDMSAILEQESNYIVDKDKNPATSTQDKAITVTNTQKATSTNISANNNANATSSSNSQTQSVKSVQKTEAVAEKIELADNLRDLSDRVTIQYRKGLASLNEVIVGINGDVAIKIIDSRNKVLKQGVFKNGDGFRVQGIPPIRVETSDSSLVSISYRGGSVVVPKQKQVSFVLPIN